ncbi:MAG: XdhC family aldehyde oxidoreductase maturation factor [Dehalococcoidia bacterium]|jgi:xanthine dehydrogenase accessory factor
MNDNEYMAKTIWEHLNSGSAVVLASITNFRGSTPRHKGTKMVVASNGKSYGTIGGSLLEATTISESRGVLTKHGSKFITFELTGTDAYSKDMICGGKADILLDFIPASKENAEFFRSLYESIRKGSDLYLLTVLGGTDSSVEILGHSMLLSDGKVIGTVQLTEKDIEIVKSSSDSVFSITIFPLEENKIIIDPIRDVKTLYCIGAGHVALPTARIAAMAGFRVVVMDDRDEFANSERFPEASEIIVIKDYDNALDGLEIDSDSFIIILTRGHKYDRTILEQALKTTAGYIGMIGSVKKRDTIYDALLEKGLDRKQLGRVHCPIGLPIAAETPAEIAVSILAELISERNRLRI